MERIKFVEGCRGLAAIMVVLSHMIGVFYPAYYFNRELSYVENNIDYIIGHSPLSFFSSGDAGVVMFLLITGFGVYMTAQSSKFNLKKFVITRYVKLVTISILGAFPVWLLIKLDFLYVLDVMKEIRVPWLDAWAPWDLSFITCMLHTPLVSFQKYNGVLWTMNFFFYGAIISYITQVLISHKLRNDIIMYIILIVMLINMEWSYYYIPCILGVISGQIYNEYKEKIKIKGFYTILLLILGLYLWSYPMTDTGTIAYPNFLVHEYAVVYHSLGVFLFFVAVMFSRVLIKIMESDLLLLLGKYSVAIYLLHSPLLSSFSSYIFIELPTEWGYHYKTSIVFVSTIMMLPIVTVLFNHLISRSLKMVNKGYKLLFD